ncbi:MAG: hypothetical protein VCD66_18140, partial [Alphaproteobacteria bacterium]
MRNLQEVCDELNRLKADRSHDNRWGIEACDAGSNLVEFRRGKWMLTLSKNNSVSELNKLPDGYGSKSTWQILKDK